MRVACAVDEIERENEEGWPVPAVVVICRRCSYETRSFGTTARSVRRCLAMMYRGCPNGEKNLYVSEDADV